MDFLLVQFDFTIKLIKLLIKNEKNLKTTSLYEGGFYDEDCFRAM